MKLLTVILLLFLVTAGIGLWVMQDPGYVLIAVGDWSLETTLILAVLVLVLAFVALYIVVRLMVWLRGVPRRWHHWRVRRQLLKPKRKPILR